MKFEFKLGNTYSYAAYIALTESLVLENKTTGPNQSTTLIDFTKLNLKRMQRLNKTLKVNSSVQNKLSTEAKPQRWIVISEAWCGDAAQNLPILNKLAEQSENIQLEIVLRDENLDIIDAFLTNGGRSIPKLIAVDDNNDVLFSWGPRPQKAQDLFTEHRNNPGNQSDEAFKLALHTWYSWNKSEEVQAEFLALV
ncbi:MAG: hypothetical protein ACI8SE_001313 [Bacteroidia bacterium]|jgi:hypothetical protein